MHFVSHPDLREGLRTTTDHKTKDRPPISTAEAAIRIIAFPYAPVVIAHVHEPSLPRLLPAQNIKGALSPDFRRGSEVCDPIDILNRFCF